MPIAILSLFRGQRGILSGGLPRALCVSLLLHFFLLAVRGAPDWAASVPRPPVAALPLSVTLAGVGLDGEPAGQAMVERAASTGGAAPIFPEGAAGLPAANSLPRILSPNKAPNSSTPVSNKPLYFRRSELSVAPELQGETSLDLPEDIVNGGLAGGSLVLRLFVSAGGGLDRAAIVSSSLSASDEEALVAALMSLHFRPGERGGVAVATQFEFEIDFDALLRGASRASDRARWRGAD